MTTVPLAEARQNFSALVDEAVATHQRILVTRNGIPAIWMISDEDFESIMETLDVLADAAAMRDISQSRADSAAGRYITAPRWRRSWPPARREPTSGTTRTWWPACTPAACQTLSACRRWRPSSQCTGSKRGELPRRA